VENNRVAAVKLLVLKGADVTKGATNGLQPMHVAAKLGHMTLLQYFLAHDTRLCNALTPDLRTP
jgi:hypothetical protein